MAIPEEPLLFTKAPNTVVDPLDDVLIPRGATKVDYEVDVAAGVDLWLDVDGVRRQTGSTTSLVFGFDVLVHYISQFLVLDPGDLINTGTPPGVAMGVAMGGLRCRRIPLSYRRAWRQARWSPSSRASLANTAAHP